MYQLVNKTLRFKFFVSKCYYYNPCKIVNITGCFLSFIKHGSSITQNAGTFKTSCDTYGVQFIDKRTSMYVRGGAGKSLARPGRKQATATKLRIYSTYSPRSSTHFLARCSNFCKPLKKKIRMLSVKPGLRGSNHLHVGGKTATFLLFFQSREHMIVRQG